ncbi:MAG TPA: TonB-dependent receptor, partial [Caulobacteraceae bacterium]
TNTEFLSQPSFDYGILMLLDNPFIPANIVAAASDPDTGLGAIFVARDNLDLGEVVRDIERDTFRTVVGFEGEVFEGIDYEVSYVFGQTKETNTERNNRINERWYAALDVVEGPNGPVCRSDLDPSAAPYGDVFLPGQSVFNPDTFGSTFTPGPNSGCVPINIFAGPVTTQAQEWVNVDTTDTAEITQQVVTAYVAGDSERWFSLPAGPLGFAAGVEWRREQSDYNPDPLLILGADTGYDITWLGQARPESGAFEVKEIFGEVSVPILRNVPFAQALTVDAAYRYSEYSLSGGANSWRFGAQWRLDDNVMFRATRARAVRAPNISELFLPENQTFAELDDPCEEEFVNLGRDPATRLANCQAALAPFGLDPQTWDNTFSASVPGIISGNSELEPETADTFTVGFVLTPTFVPGLSVALDYYDIEITDAINFFSAQGVVDNCYDLPQPNAYCTDLVRSPSANPTQNGIISSFRQFGQNVASYTTAGYDLTAEYRLDPANFGIEQDIGRFNFRLIGNRLDDLTFIEIEGVEPDSDAGEVGAPEWQFNFDLTWLHGPLTVNYGYSWFDETIRYADTYDEEPDYIAEEYKYMSERSVHDIQVRYAFDGGLELYAGVNNFTNQEPDIGALQTPVGAEGRFFYIGGKGRLADIF